jgi:hypothetical protein
MSKTQKLAMLVADVVRTSRSDRDELKLNVDDGREDLFRARNGMAALARTPVPPEATLVGALSAEGGHWCQPGKLFASIRDSRAPCCARHWSRSLTRKSL